MSPTPALHSGSSRQCYRYMGTGASAAPGAAMTTLAVPGIPGANTADGTTGAMAVGCGKFPDPPGLTIAPGTIVCCTEGLVDGCISVYCPRPAALGGNGICCAA